MGKIHPAALFIILVAVLLFLVPFSACFGDIKIPLPDVIKAFFYKNDSIESTIIWEYRLPRIFVGLLVGVNLAVSGALLQAITQNPLAAPNVVGLTAGSSFFAVLFMVALSSFPIYGLPFVSFLGAAVAGLLVYAIAWKKGINKERFALSGIAVDALFQALTTGILVYSTRGIDGAIVWLAGSLWGREWVHLTIILPWTLGGLLLLMFCYGRINVLQLGDDIATSVGLTVSINRFFLLAITIVLCGSAVAVSGPIGFVGLVIPHLTRLLVGSDYKWVIPISALLGAALVLVADLLGRSLLAPIEIPVGIFTALIGAPYFLYLLKKAKI